MAHIVILGAGIGGMAAAYEDRVIRSGVREIRPGSARSDATDAPQRRNDSHEHMRIGTCTDS
jgi:hypothetical protein